MFHTPYLLDLGEPQAYESADDLNIAAAVHALLDGDCDPPRSPGTKRPPSIGRWASSRKPPTTDPEMTAGPWWSFQTTALTGDPGQTHPLTVAGSEPAPLPVLNQHVGFCLAHAELLLSC